MRHIIIMATVLFVLCSCAYSGNSRAIAPSGTQYMRQNQFGGYDYYSRQGKIGWNMHNNYYDRRGMYMRNYNQRIYNTRRYTQPRK